LWLRRLAAQQLLLERLAPQELSALRALEALGGAAVRFQFRHLVTFARALPRRRRRGRLRPPAAGLWLARQDRVHLVAFHPRHRFGDRDVGELLHQALENPPADLGMGHLAAAEENRRLHFVAVLEEALDVLLLELIIVLVHLRTKLDLLDLDHLLMA